jgi:hypothetical protein
MHESNEPITWEADNATSTPAAVDADALKQAVAKLAAAALLVRYWPPRGNRHDLSLAIGGVLARSGWAISVIEPFVEAVVRTAQDPRPADRVRCARDAAEAVAAGEAASVDSISLSTAPGDSGAEIARPGKM